MPWIWYGIEFSWYRLLGYSILKNPIEIIGYGILIGTVIFGIMSAIKLLQNYIETKRIPTFWFFLSYLFFIIGGIFLTFEKICFSTLGLPELGFLMAMIAIGIDGFAIVFGIRFIILSTYPERSKITTLFTVILTTIFVGVIYFAMIVGPPVANIENFEIVYIPIINIIIYATLIPLLLIMCLIFYKYAFELRNIDKANSNRTLWLATGIFIFLLGYLAEVGPIFPTILSIPFRFLLLTGTIIMYIAYFMPQWFKERIGWKN